MDTSTRSSRNLQWEILELKHKEAKKELSQNFGDLVVTAVNFAALLVILHPGVNRIAKSSVGGIDWLWESPQIQIIDGTPQNPEESKPSKPPNPSQPASPGNTKFILPTNAPITSTFGLRRHPILGRTKMHTGTDFGVPHGSNIVASASGRVAIADSKGGYGKTVVLDHGGGLTTLYAHNSKLLVRSGDEVQQGTSIALSGSTGLSTGPHLHFEVRVAGKPVDPSTYLKK